MDIVKPTLSTLTRNVGRLYCEVCCSSWDKRNKKRANLIKVTTEKFKTLAVQWELVDHHFNKVQKRVDWSSKEMYSCRTCYSMFFKEEYLKGQDLLLEKKNESRTDEDREEVNTSSDSPAPLELRSSSRNRLSYETQKDVPEKMRCIICCSTKNNKKGKTVPVTSISLRSISSKKHVAEDTLLKFAEIHVKQETKFKEAAERILLVAANKSLFAADVGYHREQCYQPFRSHYWQELELTPVHQTPLTTTFLDTFKNLCDLVRLHVLQKKKN